MTLRYRPGRGVRGLIAVIGASVVTANAALLLSDRAPLLLQSIFGDPVQRITERLEAGGSEVFAVSRSG